MIVVKFKSLYSHLLLNLFLLSSCKFQYNIVIKFVFINYYI
uniref:Lipoprotein n=1 Tax=Melanothamnus harveyi TaxID=397005 RepID=A0A1Z1MHC2_MELHR|nr:hypothetical protein [Melanothamnus harveyi]ARW65468.1 hypothetical protein [Melanothamnus harveyi]